MMLIGLQGKIFVLREALSKQIIIKSVTLIDVFSVPQEAGVDFIKAIPTLYRVEAEY